MKEKKKEWNQWNERTLIENRYGKCSSSSEIICAHHCYSLGIEWKPQARCNHPHHPATTGKKVSSNGAVPLEILQFVCSWYGVTLPVGSSFCYNHLRSKSASFRAPSIRALTSAAKDPNRF